MKCEIIIDPNCDERVVIYTRKKNSLTEEIKLLAENDSSELLGCTENEVVKIVPQDIYHISVIGGKVYAVCKDERYMLKQRLYTLEEILPEYFVKINQSCLANIRKTQKFSTSISGTLKIVFKNGDTDYVSRRQLKNVKERLGI